MDATRFDANTFRHASPAPGLVPGLNFPRCRRARCRAPQNLSRNQMRNWRRQRASARELGRIHEIRLAFDILSNVLPKHENEKLSKVQILKETIAYIKQLNEMNEQAPGPVPSVSTGTWTQYRDEGSASSSEELDASFLQFHAASPESQTSSLSSYPSSGSSRTDSPFGSPPPATNEVFVDAWPQAATSLDMSSMLTGPLQSWPSVEDSLSPPKASDISLATCKHASAQTLPSLDVNPITGTPYQNVPSMDITTLDKYILDAALQCSDPAVYQPVGANASPLSGYELSLTSGMESSNAQMQASFDIHARAQAQALSFNHYQPCFA